MRIFYIHHSNTTRVGEKSATLIMYTIFWFFYREEISHTFFARMAETQIHIDSTLYEPYSFSNHFK